MLENAVLVTGAGRRVGCHIAQRLHQDGYAVIAHYRTHTDQIQALSDMGITTIQTDLADTSSILRFVDAVLDHATSIRGIIHNASSFEVTADDAEQAAEQFDQFYTIHMKAPYLINQGLKPYFSGSVEQPADIIHITDINAENPTPRFDIYGTTKAGLHNMTLALAKKYAPTIKVNSVAPGPVLFAGHHTPEIIEQTLAETLLAKEGGAEPVYLAIKSVLSNPFITGVSIPVDGGRRLSKR